MNKVIWKEILFLMRGNNNKPVPIEGNGGGSRVVKVSDSQTRGCGFESYKVSRPRFLIFNQLYG